ncbi:HlyD family efflux transporter periplasmic adaptor subunit [Fusibacter paucivorans]|uniref:HlyD family efflux transporter periplasmic adaptor subunit n=1 Tax=Fusibacter paucivorans TaxID=76009 RepID=A0ABS5PT85_9FIRM|nr:HlyD family efflux transporter periplasmic adaptor subunit [Fusibacter paucivorans]MBS7528296.1 HlyD family efflux transporter periplasmic adaptor subunit [Fusibacter paucivorans]
MKYKKLIGILLIVIIVGAAGITYFRRQTPDTTTNNTNTQVSFEIREMPLSETYTTTGTVTAKNDQTITVGFSSKVLEIYAEAGETVKAGDPIMLLDDTDLNYEIANAQYEIATLEGTIKSSEATGATSLENALNEAQTSLDDAQKSYDDAKLLYDAGSISQSDFDSYTTSLQSAKNKVTEAKNSLDSYYAKNEIALSKSKLALLKLNLENLESDLDNILIVAPFDGTIANLYYNVGENVTENSNLVQVTDLTNLQIESSISEYDVYQFKKGMSAEISTLSNKNLGLTATISNIGIIGDVSGTEVSIPVTLTMDDGQDVSSLYPNFTATVDILVSESPSALVVPFEAVSEDASDQRYVLKQSGDSLIPVTVTTGITNEIYVEIISDELTAGDTIVYSTSSDTTADTARGGLLGIGMGGGGGGGGTHPSDMGGGGTPPSGGGAPN